MADLISREEAISTIKSMLYETALNSVESDENAAQLYEDIADNRIEIWLGLVDSADAVQVVHGEWKWSHGGQCSECEFHNSNFNYKYCPNCGAKMDK